MQTKLDVDSLYRHQDYAPIKKEPEVQFAENPEQDQRELLIRINLSTDASSAGGRV